MQDLISRQAAIEAVISLCDDCDSGYCGSCRVNYPGEKDAKKVLEDLPSAQPTLYGYKIEHLAYIARVMEKEGVTADYAVRTFDNMSRVIKMIINEAQQKVEEALNE